MRRYIDNAILLDFFLVVAIGFCLYSSRPFFKLFLKLPTIENVNSFSASLITVSATLLGFLLTIITVIVTFKKGFEDETKSNNDPVYLTDFPQETIFEKKKLKEDKFYGTEIHKKVVDVFVNSAYEIGIVLLILLVVQFIIISSSLVLISIISICSFVMILLSVGRSLFMFKLFLNVHLHHKSLDKYS